ncbi:hypothetical protein HDV05_000110 [Chytridiales sp. JEL 0842]|nr:hypothetical protein HDV05_000110 [Chytridiales sp. JEL 0842]
MEAQCWDLGTRSTPSSTTTLLTNPVIYPLYPSGASAGNPIFSTIPCVWGYSDAWAIFNVVVPESTPYDSLKEYLPLHLGGGIVFNSSYVNMAVITKGSTFVDATPLGTPVPEIKTGWFAGNEVSFVEFGVVKPGAMEAWSGTVKTTRVADLKVGGGVLETVVENMNTTDAGYTSFMQVYEVNVEEGGGYTENSVNGWGDLVDIYRPMEVPNIGFRNCPVAYIEEPFGGPTFGGQAGLQTGTGTGTTRVTTTVARTTTVAKTTTRTTTATAARTTTSGTAVVARSTTTAAAAKTTPLASPTPTTISDGSETITSNPDLCPLPTDNAAGCDTTHVPPETVIVTVFDGESTTAPRPTTRTTTTSSRRVTGAANLSTSSRPPRPTFTGYDIPSPASSIKYRRSGKSGGGPNWRLVVGCVGLGLLMVGL